MTEATRKAKRDAKQARALKAARALVVAFEGGGAWDIESALDALAPIIEDARATLAEMREREKWAAIAAIERTEEREQRERLEAMAAQLRKVATREPVRVAKALRQAADVIAA